MVYNVQNFLTELGVSKEFINKVLHLPINKFYYVKHDRQGGDFGMGRIQNTQDWVCNAIEWLSYDEDNVEQDWLLTNSIENIGDFWDIEFEEITIEDLKNELNSIKIKILMANTANSHCHSISNQNYEDLITMEYFLERTINELED